MRTIIHLLGLLIVVQSAAYAQFTFTSLQFPGGTSTRTFGINDRGDVVGSYQIAPPQHALLIKNSRFVPLEASGLLGTDFSRALGNNNLGQVVGTYIDGQGVQHGFLLNGVVLTNVDFPGSTATNAWGINDSGVIVGDFLDPLGALHGFVLRAGVFTRLDVPSAADTQATAINSRGDIVGSWDTNSNTQGHGFVRTEAGQFVTIDAPAAAPQSTSALGINDRRQVVGTYTDAAGNVHGFLATGGTFTDVDVPGAGATVCRGINNAGLIVGNYGAGFQAGFVAVQGGPGKLVPVPLNILWRVVVGGTDRMTSVDAAERDAFPLEGQTFYVPAAPGLARTQTLYRLLSLDGSDHRDSTTSESGYNIEGPLGFPWTTNTVFRGLRPLFEGFNSTVGDYALWSPFERLPGYTKDSLGVYGYGRFNNLAESLLSLTGGGVTIQSNRVAGGSLWRWFWNGVQFVNVHDYGRQIQAAFFTHAGNTVRNPTEAGDLFSFPDLAPALRHGSPVFQFHNSGTTQITRAIPLEWSPDNFGGDHDHPVIWNTVLLGKDVTLDFNGMGSVARYTTHLVLPSFQAGTLEMPTPYLRAKFKRFWTYDAETDTLTEVTKLMPDACQSDNPDPAYVFAPGFGGVIVSDGAKAFAMGEYAVNVSRGGPASYLAMWKFFCFGDGTSEASFDTVKLDAVRGAMPFPGGDNAYNAYLMTDTVEGVQRKMRQLFLDDVR